ncbi:hypothetical protein ABEB36_006930 [Hypothenemus hampei]|uniref:Protein KRI1 homolog n=1 Tax=Hypothenemus hampei TaxID=57062 RepID=A0ABD1ESQ1_HYPHA
MGKISVGLFDGASDSDEEIKTENQYAKNYDNWRKKEVLNKLKSKYGDNVMDESETSSSSDDDEDAVELTEEVEKDFFKTLSCLKSKDPKIYDKNVNFFKEVKENNDTSNKSKKKKEQPIYLKDYERKMLLEEGGVFNDEDTAQQPKPISYEKEQKQIKDEIVKLGAQIESEDEDDADVAGMFQLRKKSEKEEKQNEMEYLNWLSGQSEELQDEKMKSELKPLKDFWNNPNLDNNEKFLKDYILNKRYLERDNEDYVPTYDEIIHDSDESLSGDEEEIEKQEEFEHKYNFRFEEPDQDFIKRYPRTIEKSLRRPDNRRKEKRMETKERKKKEKEEKMADIKKLRELKRKEIEEKLEKLKEVTGVSDFGFHDQDLDQDFDPEEHDKKMQELFNDDFYQGDDGDQKPEFPEIDQELELENWDHWNGEEDNNETAYEPHCEDEDFNMDADYDPSTSIKNQLIENSKGTKKRKRKSKTAEALSQPKPKFDPTDKNFEKYFDEYYKLECEDVIGDLPCRFKYREVPPNDFGLSIEEILLAKDKELNRWCSLKKTVQRRPENVEKYDQIAYAKKAKNIELKKRLLPSVFEESSKEDDSTIKNLNAQNVEVKKKDNKKTQAENSTQDINKDEKKKPVGKETESAETNLNNKVENLQNDKKHIKTRKVKRKRKNSSGNTTTNESKRFKNSKNDVKIDISDARLSAFGINPKKYKNKLKYGKQKN